mmetsp:Transcript_3819/g.14708  ORF Transcript_3819/g.14708 Transcript_3819/m.14708 type:complete len:163 (+) Transcript_3819:25-513(+)
MTTDYERWMRDARARLGGGETERLGDVALAGALSGGDDVGGFDRVVLGGVFGIDERDGAGGFGVAARGRRREGVRSVALIALQHLSIRAASGEIDGIPAWDSAAGTHAAATAEVFAEGGDALVEDEFDPARVLDGGELRPDFFLAHRRGFEQELARGIAGDV